MIFDIFVILENNDRPIETTYKITKTPIPHGNEMKNCKTRHCNPLHQRCASHIAAQ